MSFIGQATTIYTCYMLVRQREMDKTYSRPVVDERERNTDVDEDGNPTPFIPDQVPLRVLGSQPIQGVIVRIVEFREEPYVCASKVNNIKQVS